MDSGVARLSACADARNNVASTTKPLAFSRRDRRAFISCSGTKARDRTSRPTSSTASTSENRDGGSRKIRVLDRTPPSSVTVRKSSGR